MTAVLIVILSVLLGSADVVWMLNVNFPDPYLVTLRYSGIAAGLLSLGILGFQYRPNLHFCAGPPFITWIVFSLTVISSTLLNGELDAAVQSTWMILGAPLIYFLLFPSLIHKIGIKSLAAGLVLGNIPFLALSVIEHPLRFPYEGIMINPNCIGLVSVAIASGLLILLLGSTSTAIRSLYASGLIGAFVMTLFSGSRTSAVTFIVVSLVSIGILIVRGVHTAREFVAPTSAALVVLSLTFFGFGDGLIKAFDGMLSKNSDFHQTFLSERDTIWLTALADPSDWGHGSTYFSDIAGVGAHNSLIEVYGRYGVIPAFFFILFGVTTFYTGARYFIRRKHFDRYASAPLLIMCCFWVVSLGEEMFGMFAGAINIAFMISVGCVHYQDDAEVPGFAPESSYDHIDTDSPDVALKQG